MSDDSKISWTNATWNPIRGCTRVSEGCRHCYAERVAARFSGPGQPYEGLAVRKLRVISDDDQRVEARWTGDVRFVAEHLADPLKWRKPRRIFVNSMSDLFHERLTNEQIAAVFGVMAAAPHHTFQVLTKRSARMREWFGWAESSVGCSGGVLMRVMNAAAKEMNASGISIPKPPPSHGDPASWPLPNVWLGVSTENQAAADERIPELLATPVAVRWISAEPLLGPIYLGGDDWRGSRFVPRLNWIVAGCESGHGARPCDVAWLRSLRDQCAAAGVAFFLKQAVLSNRGIHCEDQHHDHDDGCPTCQAITPGPGSKRKAGGLIGLPYLDGVQHKDLPK